MWYILRAEPDSTLALGFNQAIVLHEPRAIGGAPLCARQPLTNWTVIVGHS